MNKKSQIVIFVLLGLILLIGFGFISHLNNNIKDTEIKKVTNVQFDISSIKLYVENCIQNTAKNALILIGKQGGYYETKTPYIHYNNFYRPYYLIEGLDYPSLSYIEEEISKYIKEKLPSCLNGLNEFKKQGFEINLGALNIHTSSSYNEVYIKTQMQLEIKKDDYAYQLNDFANTIKIPLGKIYNVSREIINLQLKDKNKLCLSCLNDLIESSGIYIDIFNYVNNTLIFDLRAYNTSISSDNYTSYNFTFAVKYKGVSCDDLISIDDFVLIVDCIEAKKEELKNDIILEPIPDFKINIGQEFYYDVNASGKAVNFEDFTDLFDIDKISGIIKFMPTEEQIGEHGVLVKAYDKIGNNDYESFFINITK